MVYQEKLSMKKINIVLFQPEIPQNTGNIMRTCVGFNMKLHLIRPLGFHLDENHLKRSAVDYYEYVDYEVYDDFSDFKNKNNGVYFYLTRYGNKQLSDVNFKEVEGDIYLIFGRESTGIPYDILASDLDHCFRIPSTDKIRAFNLSNCVAMSAYEVERQLGFMDLYKEEPDTLKGHDFLTEYRKKMI